MSRAPKVPSSRSLSFSFANRVPFASSAPSSIAKMGSNGRMQRIFAVATLLASALSSVEATSCEADEFPNDILHLDSYNGVVMKVNETVSMAHDKDDFALSLEASLTKWRCEGKRGIWIHIPTDFAHLVPVCISQGFEFHFAKPGMLVLTQWLPEDSESRLPHGPTHQVGIGALVINEEGHMLVVQEKTGPASEFKLWKMPTGLLDPGEDIGMAAERELKEETGLDAKIVKIVCFRQAHAGGDRGSDLFFVCLMSPIATHEQQVTAQEEEIAEVKWMDMDEFCAQEVWQGSPVYKELNAAMMEVVRGTGENGAAVATAGFETRILPVGFRPGNNAIFVPAKL
jgi:ADP-ribose pyrophosphatase YjhB (NUDIX family)